MDKPTVTIDDATGIATITVREDRLDVYNAPWLREATVDLVREAHYRQIIDLAGVKVVDSTGLGVIVGALRRLRAHDGALVLAGVGLGVSHSLNVTGLHKVLTIAASVEDAIAFFESAPVNDAATYEDDPEPAPRAGDGATCTCGDLIYFIACSHGGWWNHGVQPADGHDAQLGGPA